MNGLSFLQSRDFSNPMPMAKHWQFQIVSLEKGRVAGTAVPRAVHENPFGVMQGGFAATVLDIALGLTSISILDNTAAQVVGTVDLVVRYFAPIKASLEPLNVYAKILHQQGRQVLVEAYLRDNGDFTFAYAQSNSIIARRPDHGCATK